MSVTVFNACMFFSSVDSESLKIKLKLLSKSAKLTYAQCLDISASSMKFLFQLFVFFPGDSLFFSLAVYVVVSDSSFVSICNLNLIYMWSL